MAALETDQFPDTVKDKMKDERLDVSNSEPYTHHSAREVCERGFPDVARMVSQDCSEYLRGGLRGLVTGRSWLKGWHLIALFLCLRSTAFP